MALFIFMVHFILNSCFWLFKYSHQGPSAVIKASFDLSVDHLNINQEEEMVFPSTLLSLLLSLTLVSANLLIDDRTTRRTRKEEPEEEGRKTPMRIQNRQQRSSQDDKECQEGDPLGESYSGRMNVTASGRACQSWAASQPHEPKYTDVGLVGDTEAGDHNHCRNPSGVDPRGVW